MVRRPVRYEADVLPGLEEFALGELSRLPGATACESQAGKISFAFAGPERKLLDLRSVVGVYRVVGFPVPRPKALLGDQHLRRLLTEIGSVRALHPENAFRSLRLSMAGEGSPVVVRLKEELTKATGLALDGAKADDADLLLRLRRGADGWEALLSLSPRPLSTRTWRVCDMPGALNATVAHAMATLTRPDSTDRFYNICCGSATLLVERAALRGALSLDGGDTNPDALECARKNVEAAGHADRISLHPSDATDIPLPAGFLDAIVGDLPFGQKIGSHKENVALYPALLAEAARVLRPGGALALLTHEVKLLEDAFDALAEKLEPVRSIRVNVGGMNPRIYVARRREAC